VTLNTSAAPLLIDVYRQEITRITDSRELSLSEGIYQLLQSMSSELNTLQQAYLSTKDKALARQLMSYSALRSMIDSELDHTAAKIHDYRRALNSQIANVSALTDHHSTLALTYLAEWRDEATRVLAAESRAIVVFPVPGRPLKTMSIGCPCLGE
jgi:hypothetical protein